MGVNRQFGPVEKPRIPLSEEAAWLKLTHYCAWQERCEQEIRQKMEGWLLPSGAEERLLARLADESYWNEARFAQAYARGKLRQNGWGRRKIGQGLRFKGLSPTLVQEVILALEDEEYQSVLDRERDKKLRQVKGYAPWEQKARMMRHLLARGFEAELIAESLAEVGLR